MARDNLDALTVARMYKHIKLDCPDIADVIGPLATLVSIQNRLDLLISGVEVPFRLLQSMLSIMTSQFVTNALLTSVLSNFVFISPGSKSVSLNILS